MTEQPESLPRSASSFCTCELLQSLPLSKINDGYLVRSSDVSDDRKLKTLPLFTILLELRRCENLSKQAFSLAQTSIFEMADLVGYQRLLSLELEKEAKKYDDNLFNRCNALVDVQCI